MISPEQSGDIKKNYCGHKIELFLDNLGNQELDNLRDHKQKDIRAWLFTIARNTYFTYCKREKIYVEWEPPTEQVDIQTEFIDNLINKEQVEKIHNFLKNMKDPYKIVFELRIHGELSFEKIGRIFGKSSGWARVTYYRAKMKILEYMEAENNE